MSDESKPEKPSVTLPGTVEKIFPAIPAAEEPEKAQISIEGADQLYREIRVENALEDEMGKKVPLKEGDKVDVTIEAEPGAEEAFSVSFGCTENSTCEYLDGA